MKIINTILLFLLLLIISLVVFTVSKQTLSKVGESLVYIPPVTKVGALENTNNQKIHWFNKNVYNDNIYDLIKKIENLMVDYKPINNKELKSLKLLAKQQKKPLDQLITFRNLIATQKSINSAKVIGKVEKEIVNFYKNQTNSSNNKSISKFFTKFKDYPPIAIVNLLKNNNINVSKEVINYADLNDSENINNRNKILKDADDFENNLVAWIKKHYPNIQFKTQKELVKEQTEKFGRAVITPDILFNEPITIVLNNPNGYKQVSLIKWIDAKNYTLVNVPFILQSVNKQAEKYYNEFGPGALAFHYGLINNINVKNTLLLDASFI